MIAHTLHQFLIFMLAAIITVITTPTPVPDPVAVIDMFKLFSDKLWY